MQVTPQPPALLLAGADDLLPRALHGVRERRRVHDGRERDRKELERGAIRAVEHRLAGPRTDQELADVLTPITQGDRLDPRRRRPTLRHGNSLAPQGEIGTNIRSSASTNHNSWRRRSSSPPR